MGLKVFDLDGTLIHCDSSSQFCHFCVSKGLVKDPDYLTKEREVMNSYSAQKMQIEDYIKIQLEPLLGLSKEQVAQLSDEFVETQAGQYIYQQGREIIKSYLEAGDRVVIVSATAEFIVKAVAKSLGVEDVIAIQIEEDGVGYSDRVKGTPSYREGKVTRLKAWLAQEQLSLDQSYFYSDSINDLPLLELVDHPVATNPDAKLKALAEGEGWEILEFSK